MGLLIGSPAPHRLPKSTQQRLGRIVAGTDYVSPVTAADPDGGPPWAVRVFQTNAGRACAQVGRLVDGHLVALGRDGAFGNDGEAHVLAREAGVCGSVDGQGHMRMSAVPDVALVNAVVDQLGCDVPGEPPLPGSAKPTCPERDLRTVIVAAVGPKATEMRLETVGRPAIVQRPDDRGVLLFVLRGHPPFAGQRLIVSYGALRCPSPDPAATAADARAPSSACIAARR